MRTARTILLSLLVIGLMVPAFAQQIAKNYSNLPQNVQILPGYQETIKILKGDLKPMAIPDDLRYKGQNFDPKNHIETKVKVGKNNDQPLANPAGIMLGSSWYDSKASGNMPRQISSFSYSASEHYFNIATLGSAAGNSGKADFVSFGGNQPTYASLGTYFQFVDYSGDEPTASVAWKRIEKFPSFTGSIGQFNDGKVAALSFPFPLQGGALQSCAVNEDVGSETFVSANIPNSQTFFPRAAVDGNNNIHMLVGHRVLSESTFNEFGYMKGSNFGTNWSAETVMTGSSAGAGAMPNNAGNESYAIDADGNTVIFAYVDRNLNFLYKKSLDGGNTWSGLYLLWRAEYDTVYTKGYYGWTDSAMSPGLVCDAMIDNNGDYHFVVNVMVTSHQGEVKKNAQNQWEWVPGTDSAKYVGLFYPKIGFVHVFIPKDTTVQGKLTIAGPPSDGEFIPQQNNYLPFYYSTTFLNDSTPGAFCVSDPNLAYDPDGNIYLTYTSIRDSINSSSQPDSKILTHSQSGQTFAFYNRHIFGTRYDRIANTWSRPVNLTPNAWDCSNPSLAKKLIKKKGETRLPLIYTADQEPSNFIRFNSIFTMISEPKTYVYPFKLQDYSGGNAVEDNQEINASIDVMPNPVEENAIIYFSNSVPGSMKVEVFNMLGQKVLNVFDGVSVGGVQSFDMNSSTLNNGTYICKITNGINTATKTIVVSK